MARKTTDIGELARALRAPGFKNAVADAESVSLDPVSPTTLFLRVSEIKTYEHNPRRAENLEYPRLKDSIRTRRGLTTPLTVTKRPGDDLYTIAAGGNSRLRILKELAEETGDEAFVFVTCRFEPWDSEIQVFANHLIENDIRGTMTFGDKARAILEWQRLYEESHPSEAPLSKRQLADRLAEAGYRVHQPMITPLLATARQLLPHLPNLFESGLGRPGAERLVRLRASCAQYWNDNLPRAQAHPSNSTFDELFVEVCTQHDCHCADWDHELFESALTLRVAKAFGLDHKLVALDIDSLYHGYAIETPEVASASPTSDAQGLKAQWAFGRSREIDAIRMERANARIERRATGDARRDRHESVPASPPSGDTDGSSASEPARLDPSRLRQGNYLAARELAATRGLDQFVKPTETGFGFFIEAPEPSAVAPESRDRPTGPAQGLALNGMRSGLWWLLCLAADQLPPAHLTALGQSYPASWLVELFTELPKRSPETDPVAMLHLLVGEPTAQGLVCDVLTDPSLTDEERDALDRLLRGCATLRADAAAGSHVLWETAR